jgi:hypothetical protein
MATGNARLRGSAKKYAAPARVGDFLPAEFDENGELENESDLSRECCDQPVPDRPVP